MGRRTESDQPESAPAQDFADESDDDHESPLAGDAFLTANRANRVKAKEQARAEALRKESRTPGRVATPRREPGRLRTLVALCAVLAVVAAGCASWAVLASRTAAQTDPGSAHGQDAMSTARNYVAAVMTYQVTDYRDLDRRIREISTTGFAEKFIESSADARKGNTAAGASSKASAPDAGLIALSADRAEVLVALDQTITAPTIAAELPEGHLYQSRVKVTLVRDGDRWLLDDFRVV